MRLRYYLNGQPKPHHQLLYLSMLYNSLTLDITVILYSYITYIMYVLPVKSLDTPTFNAFNLSLF